MSSDPTKQVLIRLEDAANTPVTGTPDNYDDYTDDNALARTLTTPLAADADKIELGEQQQNTEVQGEFIIRNRSHRQVKYLLKKVNKLVASMYEARDMTAHVVERLEGALQLVAASPLQDASLVGIRVNDITQAFSDFLNRFSGRKTVFRLVCNREVVSQIQDFHKDIDKALSGMGLNVDETAWRQRWESCREAQREEFKKISGDREDEDCAFESDEDPGENQHADLRTETWYESVALVSDPQVTVQQPQAADLHFDLVNPSASPFQAIDAAGQVVGAQRRGMFVDARLLCGDRGRRLNNGVCDPSSRKEVRRVQDRAPNTRWRRDPDPATIQRLAVAAQNPLEQVSAAGGDVTADSADSESEDAVVSQPGGGRQRASREPQQFVVQDAELPVEVDYGANETAHTIGVFEGGAGGARVVM
ncbi:hypothetical protein PybrP1_012721 [[Pythium] brassicae (nom. inval.)]|nr:hypothetical protein PybrP1_012721 [[Pythium] brassicae (nom. inval.)]